MILLLGGTSETAPLALALAESGFDVLVSTATNIALETGRHAKIRRRSGRLDAAEMSVLVRRERIRAIVDATHPYAAGAHRTAREAAADAGVLYVRFARPGSALQAGVDYARDHADAARLACDAGGPVLLTTGSRNLAPYVAESTRRGVELLARVLPEAESLAACRAAGLSDARIVAARGPFSVEQNRALIRERGIRILVTKESGDAGGFEEKIVAARAENCRVVVVCRPLAPAELEFSSAPELVSALLQRLRPRA